METPDGKVIKTDESSSAASTTLMSRPGRSLTRVIDLPDDIHDDEEPDQIAAALGPNGGRIVFLPQSSGDRQLVAGHQELLAWLRQRVLQAPPYDRHKYKLTVAESRLANQQVGWTWPAALNPSAHSWTVPFDQITIKEAAHAFARDSVKSHAMADTRGTVEAGTFLDFIKRNCDPSSHDLVYYNIYKMVDKWRSLLNDDDTFFCQEPSCMNAMNKTPVTARIWQTRESDQGISIGHNWSYGRNPPGCRVLNTIKYLLSNGIDVDGFEAIRLFCGIQPEGMYVYMVVVTCRMRLVHSRFCV